ncbi:Hpt domain-containing protein [Natrinema zhouii]|uniref:Chemotaxis protein CheA n=1 Tax=Natrinema zhouii TaxID=1710539 RepID=A0A7D6GZ25_9EURY|nr:Hpt domain-containing protein [Natrinema zhouii]QLK25465.1 Hpt domain-containing protein [Natrinema zhouii]
MTDYLTDFVQESEERITELNNALLTLESDPDDEEAMENIFRIAHTLKGNCGAMGLTSASDLAHAVEDLLDAIRGDEIDVTPELMDIVFDAVDELETMVDEVAATGEIETDPSATIDALRTHLEDAELEAAAGLVAPTAGELDAVCSRFDPPADDAHDVYLARLEIVERDDVNNGELVVDALIDAFDLIGTDPPRETIEAAEYGGRFDAVFGTAVGKGAISSGLEPVEAVADFELVDVSDRFEADEAVTADRLADAAERDDGISAEEAQDLEVDDLLNEFTEFDDLDEMVEDVEADELEAFDNMGEAGSFDDLLGDDDLDLGTEPGEPPATPLDEADEAATSEPETATADATETATDDGSRTDSTAEADDADDVEDASAVFDELKDEVEMVGFDELQDELAELEFDEFDAEDEVDMDELLGEDVDDDTFLDGEEPSESAVDDILVDAGSDDDHAVDVADDEDEITASSVDTVSHVDVDEDPVGDEDGLEPSAEPDDEGVADDDVTTVETDNDVAAVGTDDDMTVVEPDDDMTVVEPDDDMAAVEPDEDVVADADDGVAAGTADEIEPETAPDQADDVEPMESDLGVSSDEPADVAAAETDAADGTAAGEAAVDDSVSDETVGDEPVIDDAVDDEPVTDETVDDADEMDERVGDAETADDIAVADTGDTEPIDDAGEPAATGDEAGAEEPTDTLLENDDSDLESTEDTAEDDTEDDVTTGDSFSADVDDWFDPTAAFDDDLEGTADDSDPFNDEDAGTLDDDAFDDFAAESVDSDADDDFESEFGDTLSDDLDDEAFAGTDEFGVGDTAFDSPAASDGTDDSSDPSTDSFGDDAAASDGTDDSSDPSTDSFGDDAAASDADGADDDVVRSIVEPEFEIPDISIPETSDRSDADAETDEIQSVRVDVEQINSLLTLVEGLVTSRVRLRHAADVDDDSDALETELDALSSLTTDLQETVMDIRLVPLQTVTNRLPRVVRDIARDQEKTVAFEMTGEDVELDRSILDRIGDPLIHLVRNAVDHGIESPEEREADGKPREGTVEVHADRARDRVTITVEDDGAGLDPDRLRSAAVVADVLDEDEAAAMTDDETYDLIFHPGLSTVDEVTDVSGRGVGMDVVKRTVEDLDGTVSIDSAEGEGTSVTMQLPVTVAIDEILFVESGGEEFGVPTKAVRDIESATAIETAGGESVLPSDDGDYPVISLIDCFGMAESETDGDGMVVRIRGEVRDVALHCDHVSGQQETVVKPFEGFMSGVPGISGATVRGRGEVVNILDVTTL